VLASSLAAWSLSGCNASRPEPGTLFQSIYTDYLHGNLDVAHTRAEQARKEFSTAGSGNSPPWGVKFRLLEAEILLRQSHAEEVIALLTHDNVAVPPQGDLAIKRNLLCAMAHSKLDQSELSHQELHAARQLAESGHSVLIADVLRAEGVVARDSGHLEEATDKFRSSLAALREDGDPLVRAADLVDIGFNEMQSHHFVEAITWFQRAAEFAAAVQAHRQLQLALGNLGWSYQNLGDFDRALSNFLNADRQAQESGMTANRVVWLQDAGQAEHRLGNLQEARKYDEQALHYASMLPAGKAVDQIANTETNLAQLLYEQAQYDAARKYSDDAARVAQNSKDDNVVAYARFMQGLLASHETGNNEAQSILMSAWKLVPDPDLHAEIENAIAKLYSGRQQPAQAQLWYRRSIQTFEDKRSTVKDLALRLAAFGYGDKIYRDYADFLIGMNKPIDALQLLDRSRARTLEEGLHSAGEQPHALAANVSDPRAVARKLHAAILFYSLGPEQSHLWVVTGQETRLFTLPGEKEIQSLVEKHQRQIRQLSDAPSNADSAVTSLYDALIKPAIAMIPGDSRIFIVPDGVLHGLNFETLLVPTANGPKYWIEDATVTTASSIHMLSLSEAVKAQAATRDLLLIGNPVSDQGGFAALPNAATEVQRIQQHFPSDGELVLTQAMATPTAYVASKPDQFRYIHFTAHGTASRLSPLDSAVVLSPPQNAPEDFKLYARDVVQHPLHATLVTISACSGSGVRTYAGEGLVGLAWVFLRAGSHNVIAALWPVSDAASPLVMDRLYSELQAGKPPDEALRIAKLALIHSTSVYRKPLFWGAFQLYAGS
jgi:CHAT domain-containing protein/outer membrane protein assembly factor BamD (BamD/ComL family)